MPSTESMPSTRRPSSSKTNTLLGRSNSARVHEWWSVTFVCYCLSGKGTLAKSSSPSSMRSSERRFWLPIVTALSEKSSSRWSWRWSWWGGHPLPHAKQWQSQHNAKHWESLVFPKLKHLHHEVHSISKFLRSNSAWWWPPGPCLLYTRFFLFEMCQWGMPSHFAKLQKNVLLATVSNSNRLEGGWCLQTRPTRAHTEHMNNMRAHWNYTHRHTNTHNSTDTRTCTPGCWLTWSSVCGWVGIDCCQCQCRCHGTGRASPGTRFLWSVKKTLKQMRQSNDQNFIGTDCGK